MARSATGRSRSRERRRWLTRGVGSIGLSSFFSDSGHELAFALAGSGIGLAETAESALVARLLPDHLRGSGFGLLGGVQSFGDFASSAAVGLLWTAISSTAGFVYAATSMLVATASALRTGAITDA